VESWAIPHRGDDEMLAPAGQDRRSHILLPYRGMLALLPYRSVFTNKEEVFTNKAEIVRWQRYE
jgi:hypothetical protein